MNFKLRIQNKATLIALISTAVALIYQVLGSFDIVPKISQDLAIQIGAYVVTLLVTLGVIVDPTTQGIGDSGMAMNYTEPRVGEITKIDEDVNDTGRGEL